MFDVTVDPALRLMRITMRGFWSAMTMAEYSSVVRRKMGMMLSGRGCRYILIDMIDFPIQSKEIAEGHAAFLRIVSERGGTRVALVMQSALSKLQAARVASDTGHATFDSEEAAIAWLLSDTQDGKAEQLAS